MLIIGQGQGQHPQKRKKEKKNDQLIMVVAGEEGKYLAQVDFSYTW